MSGNIDPNFMETYQQRIAEIQDVSDVIAVANLQLSKLMQKFGWSRQSFQEKVPVVECPVNSEHKVAPKHLADHMKICTLRKNGIVSVTKKDLLSSSSYFYEKTNVVSVNLTKESYKRLGITLPEVLDKDMKESQSNKQQKVEVKRESLVQHSDEINQYVPCDSLDELRFIYSWSKIPPKYFQPNIYNLPYENMKNWLHENIPDAMDTGNENKHSIVNFVTNQLKDIGHPDDMVEKLVPVLKAKTQFFVLKFWKYVCAKQLCIKSHIPEHTRNEFDFYGTALLSSKQDLDNEAEGKGGVDEFTMLSNDWTFFRLSREQRVKIYEEVRKTGDILCQDETTKFADLQEQAEEQVKVITDFELKDKGEKTHLEVMVELRDYKRRRLSYRGKNKENRKMSGIEVLRELVEQQMYYLKILYQQQNKTTVKESEDNSLKDNTKIDGVIKDQLDATNRDIEQRGEEKNNEKKPIQHSRSRDRNHSRDSSRNRNRDRSRSRDSRHKNRSRSRSRERYHRRSRSRERRRSGKSRRSDSKGRRDYKGNIRDNEDQKEVCNITYYSTDT